MQALPGRDKMQALNGRFLPVDLEVKSDLSILDHELSSFVNPLSSFEIPSEWLEVNKDQILAAVKGLKFKGHLGQSLISGLRGTTSFASRTESIYQVR
jgi:hypothetical protein